MRRNCGTRCPSRDGQNPRSAQTKTPTFTVPDLIDYEFLIIAFGKSILLRGEKRPESLGSQSHGNEGQQETRGAAGAPEVVQ